MKWLLIYPRIQQGFLQNARGNALKSLGRKRGTNVITLIHRQETLSLFGLPLGKAITGLTAGFLSKGFKLNNRKNSLTMIPTTLISYIPEGIYTYGYFAFLMPFFLGLDALGSVFIIYILPKAIAEIVIITSKYFLIPPFQNPSRNTLFPSGIIHPSKLQVFSTIWHDFTTFWTSLGSIHEK